MLCASPAYLERHGTPRTPEELAQHQLLHYDIGGGPLLRLTDDRGGELQLPVQPRLTANNGDFLRDMAIAGHGVILTPTFIAWPVTIPNNPPSGKITTTTISKRVAREARLRRPPNQRSRRRYRG